MSRGGVDRAAGKLLLVDDERAILSALQRCLRREGYEILVAESASEALQIVDRERPDLVLSDLKMPAMDGLTLLAEVARRRPGTKLALISGWSEAANASRLEALGVRALVPKPWDPEQLRRTLRALLDEA